MRIEDLESSLDDDLSWRKKELSSLYSIAFNTKQTLSPSEDQVLYKTIVKTLYLLLYSHWEGFIKKSCKIYLTYINQKKLKTFDLTSNFSALLLKKSINQCYNKENQDSLSISIYLNFVDLHKNKLNDDFKVPVKVEHDFDDGFINTFSNLNFKNYRNIIESLSLPFYSYFHRNEFFINVTDVNGKVQEVESLTYLLDFSLLSYRHSIAHGGAIALNLELNEYEILEQQILYIMDHHKSDIQEFCYNELYKNSETSNKEDYISKKNILINSFFENMKKQLTIPDEEFLCEAEVIT